MFTAKFFNGSRCLSTYNKSVCTPASKFNEHHQEKPDWRRIWGGHGAQLECHQGGGWGTYQLERIINSCTPRCSSPWVMTRNPAYVQNKLDHYILIKHYIHIFALSMFLRMEQNVLSAKAEHFSASLFQWQPFLIDNLQGLMCLD